MSPTLPDSPPPFLLPQDPPALVPPALVPPALEFATAGDATAGALSPDASSDVEPSPPSSPARPRVLLVTDDPSLLDAVASLSAIFAFDATPLTGGAAPLRVVGHALAIVDLRLAPERGLRALEGLRHHAPGLPMLALVPPPCAQTALAATRLGADDFCRATDRMELQLRLQALQLRRSLCPVVPALQVGELELDPVARTVRRAGVRVELSARQFDLLQVLMRHAGEVMSREQIEAEMPAGSGDRASNVVEVHIHHLRRRIGAQVLSTIRGQGYLLRAGG